MMKTEHKLEQRLTFHFLFLISSRADELMRWIQLSFFLNLYIFLSLKSKNYIYLLKCLDLLLDL